MKKIENKFVCECGNEFNWHFLLLEKNKFWVGRFEERIKNCVDFLENDNNYSVRVKCPECKRISQITIEK